MEESVTISKFCLLKALAVCVLLFRLCAAESSVTCLEGVLWQLWLGLQHPDKELADTLEIGISQTVRT